MITPFRIKLSLATAITLNFPLTLDALLSAAVANATGLEGDDTLPHIPLEQREGIFCASAMFMHARFRHEVVGRVMALRGERDVSVHCFRPNGKQYVNVHTDKGKKYANKLSSYPGYRTQEVYFYGVGDAEKVAYLISNFIPGIGKKATGGAGEIVSVSIMETEDDYSWVRANKTPARPLPVELWKQIGGNENSPTMPLAVKLPYWKTSKVESVFPGSLII